MLKDITLGQYYPGDSVVHRLDPRVKMILMIVYIVMVFLVQGFLGYVCLAAFLAAATGTYHSITFGAGVSINGVTYDNVMLLDDLPCIFVPQSRMKTAVTVQDGNENAGGIVSATGAQDINVLLAHCSAPLAVSKLDSIKQFGPEENQFFDGTAIQARYLYDLFVPTKSVVSIGAIIEPAQAAGGN